jgi:hypothetical protein
MRFTPTCSVGSAQACRLARLAPPNVAGMNLTLSQCFVLVHDPDLALAFYRDTLGLGNMVRIDQPLADQG